jgi:anaerobic selenocysteine-containing dehydrogenase
METTRRNLLALAGGSVVGALFTPAPWRLITDTALWSENWPGIPRPARGEIRVKFTNCPLCPAGCAVRARCVGDQPVSLAGVPGHPVSRGALCPFGLLGHHLPYHPERLRQGPAKEAAAAVSAAMAKCGPTERFAVLDLRPGRTASWTYRRALAAVPNGLYLAPSSTLGGSVAVDLSNARTVMSFNVPVLDGWGTPGNVLAARERFRLIHAGPLETRTATLADLWLPIRPGTEAALALGIAHVLLDGGNARELPQQLVELAGKYPPATAAAITGIPEGQIISVARELADNGPALVLDAGDSAAVLALNLLIGAPGRTIVTRREAPVPDAWKQAAAVSDLASVPDRSIRVLLIDESLPGAYVPWTVVEKKLVTDNPLVVAFAWSREGYGRYAKYVLPTAVYPEAVSDVPAAVDSVAAIFRISAPLVAPPEGMTDPAEFIGSLAGVTGPNALRERADAIQKAGRGDLFTYADSKTAPVKEMKPDDFWKALNEGGCWMDAVDENAAAPKLAFGEFKAETRAAEPAADLPLAAVLTEWHSSATLVPPLMSKLYQESNLRLAPNRAALNPADARASGVEDGGAAVLETRSGKLRVEVTLDSGVPHGTVQVAAGPEVLDICGADGRARVVRA